MIPQIARRLIIRYSQEGDLVWDPFCGSGTTLVESMLLGRRSIGTDLNPFAIFLSRVKTTPIDASVLRDTSRKVMMHVESVADNVSPSVPKIPNIEYWFKSYVQRDLARLRHAIDAVANTPEVREFFLLCLALTVREVSNAKKGEFKIVRMSAERLTKFRPDVRATFVRHADRCISLIDQFVKYLEGHQYYRPAVIEADNRSAPVDDESIDLVVTSPPYGDSGTTVAYGQYSRFPALWIGLDEDAVRTVDKRGLGGSNHRSEMSHLGSVTLAETLEAIRERNPTRAQHVYSFFRDLTESLVAIRDRLKTGRYASIVIGNRMVARVRIPTDRIVAEIADARGLAQHLTIPRRIPTKRMPWQNAPENIEGLKADTMHTESIVILRKV